MSKTWTADAVLQLTGGFQGPCVVFAAAELDLFAALADGAMSAEDLAERLGTDLRATAILTDALTAMELLVKDGGRYRAADGVPDILTAGGAESVLAMVRHQGTCLGRWAQLARTVRTGKPAERDAHAAGDQDRLAFFIGAMDNIHRIVAPRLIAELGPPRFSHLLDVGGASGTWTIAFLAAGGDEATATIFDLPDVIPMAEERIAAAGLKDRVNCVGGDFYADDLPAGADLVWLSAIIHQNSRRQNRDLYAKIHAALTGGGRILIRDVVMEPCRTRPPRGALFAVNMLSATAGGGGGTFTFDEIREDLLSAGFAEPKLLASSEWMDSVVEAVKA